MEIPENKIEALANLYYQPTRYCFELRKLGEKMVTEEERKQILVFIPTNLKFLGMKMPDLKKIANKTTKLCIDRPEILFKLLEILWNDATREGRQISAEILVKTSSKYPEKTFEFIEKRLTHIGDWELCDRLACMSIKKLLKNDFAKFNKLISMWIEDENLWVRRFGTVCLVTLAHLGHPDTSYITKNLEKVMEDREYYVKKSVGWVLRELTKYYDPEIAYKFMLKHTRTENKDTKWILRDGSEKLSDEKRQKILKRLK
jgi:3-methyladenine DNA glycosylase AlkD